MRHLIAVLALTASIFAQDKSFTIDDALNAGKFVPRGLARLAWHPDGESFTWIAREGGELKFFRQDLGGKQSVVLGWSDLSVALKKVGIENGNAQAMASLAWRPDGKLGLNVAQTRCVVTLDPLAVAKVFDPASEAEVVVMSRGGRHAAFVRARDVWVMKDLKEEVRVTTAGGEDRTHGIAVSRVEFGITDGLWWDPTGRRVAFYEEDLSPIDPYPYIDHKAVPAGRVAGRYPMAGRNGSRVRVGVFDVATSHVAWLETDPKQDEYLTNVTWHPSGDRIVVAHVNRAQNRCEVIEYDAGTGKRARLLFVESDREWIEPEHGPIWLPDGSGDFLWVSYRDGFRHFWHYRGDGRLVGQVTKGRFDLDAFVRWASDGKGFYWSTTGPNPLQMHLYYTSLDGGTQRAITSGRGHHRPLISADETYLLDVHESLELPEATDLVNMKEGKVVRRVHVADDPFKGFAHVRQSFFTVKNEDGQDLHGILILPPKPPKNGTRYPVINYVYGGPHSQLVTDRFLSGFSRWTLWLHAMAHRGYASFILDGRGTTNRGIEWVQAVFRRLGELEADDQIRGLESVLSREDTDRDRVGVTGWSYGGFMTLTMMTRKPEWYRAGVSGAPVTNWKYYETGYGERYMDTPEENPEGYRHTDPGSRAEKIKGRLLVVQGTRDDTVVWQHTIDFLGRCIEAGAPVDYMVYPGHVHGLRGKAFAHFIRKMTDYFDRNVRDAKPATGK